MKKIYMQPTTDIVLMSVQPLMAGSFGTENGDQMNGGGDMGNYVEGSQLSRRRGGGFWDDAD